MECTEYCKILNKKTNKFFSGKNGRNLWRFEHHATEAFNNSHTIDFCEDLNHELQWFVLIPLHEFAKMTD